MEEEVGEEVKEEVEEGEVWVCVCLCERSGRWRKFAEIIHCNILPHLRAVYKPGCVK